MAGRTVNYSPDNRCQMDYFKVATKAEAEVAEA